MCAGWRARASPGEQRWKRAGKSAASGSPKIGLDEAPWSDLKTHLGEVLNLDIWRSLRRLCHLSRTSHMYQRFPPTQLPNWIGPGGCRDSPGDGGLQRHCSHVCKKGLYWHEGTFASENYTARITVNQNLTQCRGKNTSRLAALVTFYISASKCFLTGLSSKICWIKVPIFWSLVWNTFDSSRCIQASFIWSEVYENDSYFIRHTF